MRTFVIGDIHGYFKKFKECLDEVKFDYDNDRLVQLGDVVDRGPDSFLVVEELLKIKNLIAIRGNHDATWRDAIIKNDPIANALYTQGGRETYESYLKYCHEADDGRLVLPDSHIEFFLNTQKNYWIDEDNNLFVHGGFNRHNSIDDQEGEHVYYWDRDLWMAALSYASMKNNEHPFKIKDSFKKIYIGHTPTIYWGVDHPMTAANIINMDAGCGKGGKLWILNLQTEELYGTE